MVQGRTEYILVNLIFHGRPICKKLVKRRLRGPLTGCGPRAAASLAVARVRRRNQRPEVVASAFRYGAARLWRAGCRSALRRR